MADHTGPTDAGRTSGGGSLGHSPVDDVQEEAPLRNNATERNRTTQRSNVSDTDTDDPVMPSDDSTLNTKI